MRTATFVALLALGLSAYAGEGPLLRSQMRPASGIAFQDFTVTESELKGLTQEQRDDVKDKVQKLNAARKELKAKLAEAHEKLAKAQEEVNKVLAGLDEQEVGFIDWLKNTLGEEQGERYATRRKLLPIIEWLKLSEAQAARLIEAQSALLKGADARRKIAEAAKRARAEALKPPPDPKLIAKMTEEERKRFEKERADARKAQIQLLKDYTDFHKKWLANIRQIIEGDEEKMKLWNARFRRTRYTIPGAGPGGGTE